MNNLNKLYDLILEGLYSSYDIESEEAKKAFLNSLKPYVTELRTSFKNKQIKVDYRDKNVQAAYLIAYYPSYVEMTYEVLNRHEVKVLPVKDRILDVCLFGAGAAPEALALLNFINQNALDIDEVNIYAYDVFASTWNFSLDLVRKYIIPHFWQSQKFQITSLNLDLCEHGVFERILKQIQNSDLFIFQNCLNELNDKNTAIANINYLANNINQGSRIIIADLSAYQITSDIKLQIDQNLQELSYLKLFKSKDKNEIRVKIPLPSIIRQHLLTGKPNQTLEQGGILTPRSIVRFTFISAYYPLPEVKDTIPDSISLEALETYIKKLEANQSNIQQENERLNTLLSQMQQQIFGLQNQLDQQLNSHTLSEDAAIRVTEDKSVELKRLDQSLVAVDSSLRELVRQNRDSMIAQTRLAQQRLERKLWWAISFASGAGMIALIVAVISILRR
jgi:hypothetical protein